MKQQSNHNLQQVL